MHISPHFMGLLAGLEWLFSGAVSVLQAAACVLVILACIKYLRK